MNGKIYVVGIGPGKKELMSFQAVEAIRESQVIIGYKTYTGLITGLIDGKTVIASGMYKEQERCCQALEYAGKGLTVTLISSGDSGVYGMAGLILETAAEAKSTIPVEIIPGITSALSAAAVLGAPLTNDFAVISLSDLLTDWSVIKKRLTAAGAADFVICLYNPKSRERRNQIVEARRILLKYRSGQTPVGIVRNSGRSGEITVRTTLDRMLEHEIDMSTLLIIGNSKTCIIGDKMITPRGYRR